MSSTSARRNSVWAVAAITCCAIAAARLYLVPAGGERRDAADAVAHAAPDSAPTISSLVEPPVLSDADAVRAGARTSLDATDDAVTTAESAPPAAPAWDEVRAEFVGRMYLTQAGLRDVLQNTIGSPLAPDAAWLEERFGPAASADALARAEAAMIEQNLRIEFEAQPYLQDLAQAVQEVVDGGRYARNAGPVESLKASEPLILLQSTSARGWNTVLTISRNEFPDLAAKQKEIVGMRTKRDEICAQLMRGG